MSAIELLIEPREKDLGGFSVGRILPFAKKRMVGPFIFLDHMGPAHFDAGQGIDVRPHPHIGLSTLTYLFEGEIFHRDTLGSEQLISAGAVNWMTAGRGVVHSERTRPEKKAVPHPMHGLQSWIALPREDEETAPSFNHHPAASLPEYRIGDVALRLIAGRMHGYESPVHIYSPLCYAEARIPAGSSLSLAPDYAERAVYLVSGALDIGGTSIAPRTMPVFTAGDNVTMTARADSVVMILGGEPFAEPRFIWWNFVSTSQARIEAAKQDWLNGRFGTIAGDDREFIPLPVE